MNLCGFEVGNDRPLFLIAGTCVVESEQMTLDTAGAFKEVCGRVWYSVYLQVVVRQGES